MFRRPTDEAGAAAWDKGQAWTKQVFKRAFGPRADGINWRGPNWWTIAGLCFALFWTRLSPPQSLYGHDISANVAGFTGWLFAIVVRRVVASYGAAIDEFSPASPVQAKRANEQIKLMATLVNGAAGAAVTIFALSELVKSKHPDYVQIIIAVALALWIHSAARALLGKLKDEAPKLEHAPVLEDRPLRGTEAGEQPDQTGTSIQGPAS